MSELDVDEGKLNTYRMTNDRPDTANPTGWRISSTLREFPTPPDFDVWFDWPLHVPDYGGILKSTKEQDAPSDNGRKKKPDHVAELEEQFAMETDFSGDNAVASDDLMAVLDIESPSTLKSYVNKSSKLMQATVVENVEKVSVVTKLGVEEITYGGIRYVPKRSKSGTVMKNQSWRPKGEQTRCEL
jgi:hypothetical protein